jgi:hypothetical protein
MTPLTSARLGVAQNISLHPLALLDRILRDLELSPTQLAEARTSYEAVTQALAKAGMPVAPFLPWLFAQGSMRIGTTVKPVGQEEHDLDIVCLLKKGGIWLPANEIYELVWETLGNDATYEKMRERRNRCIRLRYAHRYYLDIIPAVPHSNAADGTLLVCDCEGRTWSVSNPIGFAEWFDERAKAQPLFITKFGALSERSVTANAGQVEPLPEHGFQKTPLQRITQLFKRNRDEFFLNEPKHRPSSILLTTLAARSYVRETSVAADDLFEFVIRVADGLSGFVEIQGTTSGPQIYRVSNPVNDAENFAENWTRLDYEAFTRWQQKLVQQLRAVKATKGQGIDTMLNRLVEGFGEDRVIKAANDLGVDTSRVHQAKRLRVAGATGAVGLAGSAMAATTYHGA